MRRTTQPQKAKVYVLGTWDLDKWQLNKSNCDKTRGGDAAWKTRIDSTLSRLLRQAIHQGRETNLNGQPLQECS